MNWNCVYVHVSWNVAKAMVCWVLRMKTIFTASSKIIWRFFCQTWFLIDIFFCSNIMNLRVTKSLIWLTNDEPSSWIVILHNCSVSCSSLMRLRAMKSFMFNLIDGPALLVPCLSVLTKLMLTPSLSIIMTSCNFKVLLPPLFWIIDWNSLIFFHSGRKGNYETLESTRKVH